MGGVLRAEPLWVETFTGLRMDRFAKLVKAIRERGGSGPGGGRVVVSAAAGPGAAGGRVLPHEPHDAAARAAVGHLADDGVPGHPAAPSAAGASSGLRAR
ncbi:hypothetical protein GCM10010331_78780 [Streptomyces xanthochromogenes]|nr:hypothetical protein GCM10010331_78780 [Streptomyces xanthochromogenes]